jgi:hypothetical protein
MEGRAKQGNKTAEEWPETLNEFGGKLTIKVK